MLSGPSNMAVFGALACTPDLHLMGPGQTCPSEMAAGDMSHPRAEALDLGISGTGESDTLPDLAAIKESRQTRADTEM